MTVEKAQTLVEETQKSKNIFLIKTGQFFVKKYIKNYISEFELNRLPKNVHAIFLNNLKTKFLNFGSFERNQLLFPENLYLKWPSYRFSAECQSSNGIVYVLPIKKLLTIIPKVEIMLQNKYKPIFEASCLKFDCHLEKLRNLLSENANLVSGITTMTEGFTEKMNCNNRENGTQVRKIASLNRYINKVYDIRLNERKEANSTNNLHEFQIFNSTMKEKKLKKDQYLRRDFGIPEERKKFFFRMTTKKETFNSAGRMTLIASKNMEQEFYKDQ